MPTIEMRDSKKLAVVFKDKNGKWMGASLPFPALEGYGCDDNGEGKCRTKKEAVQACLDADCVLISEKEVNEKYV